MHDRDWIFDLVMDLSDKAEQLGLTAMSAKLEDALDAFLDDQRRNAGPISANGTQFAPVGPISLAEDEFAFGLRRRAVAQSDTASEPPETAQPFSSRRPLPSQSIQQLTAARAKREAEQPKSHGDSEPALVLDKAG